jgi:hypothetical protein
MRTACIFFGCLSILSSVSCTLHYICSGSDRTKLAEFGYAEDEIDSACTTSNASHSGVSIGTTAAIRPPIEIPFDDGIFWVLQRQFEYQILDTDIVVTVPQGFVTDYASIPRVFWSVLAPYGRYGSPAIIHDFLYWDQSCTREEADGLFDLAMQEQGVPNATRIAIYAAVRFAGEYAWVSNLEEKQRGLSKIVPSQYLERIPPKTSWLDLRQLLYKEDIRPASSKPASTKPGYCNYKKLRLSPEAKYASRSIRMSPNELVRLIGKPGTNVRIAVTCETKHGQCPLTQPGTNGSTCTCYSTFGQIPGVMR